jgi:hypothetical protein
MQAVLFLAALLFATVGSSTPASASHITVTAVRGSAFGSRADQLSLFGGTGANVTDIGPTPTVTLLTDASNSPQSATAPTGLVNKGPAKLFTSDAITVNSTGSLGTSGSVTTTSNIQNVNYAATQEGSTGSEIFGYPPPETDTSPVSPSGHPLAWRTSPYINFNPNNVRTSVAGTATASPSGVSGSTTITNGILRTHKQASDDCPSYAFRPCGRAGEEHLHEPAPTVLNPNSNPEGVVTIPTDPPPNYAVGGHLHLGDSTTDYFVLVFNEQVVNPDGSITVTPVHEYFGYKLVNGNIVRTGPR